MEVLANIVSVLLLLVCWTNRSDWFVF